jgi:hypothetical protein
VRPSRGAKHEGSATAPADSGPAQPLAACARAPQVGAAKLSSDLTLNWGGIEGFRIAGKQGIGIIAACQAVLMVGCRSFHRWWWPAPCPSVRKCELSARALAGIRRQKPPPL